MKLDINDSFYITDIAPSDRAAYVEHLKEKEIHDHVSAIPYPYTEKDADWWIDHVLSSTKDNGGRSSNWVIRRSKDDYLVGGIGFLDLKLGQTHKAELGYWLAKPFWGQGLMTEAVKRAAGFAFQEFGLTRITAHVFDFNKRSARVLQKTGFQYEGCLRQHFKKNGQIFDGLIYSLLKEDLVGESPLKSRHPLICHYSDIQEEDNAHYPGSDELLSIGSPFSKKLGMKKLGIHHEVLKPGRRTSWPHAESDEEEFAYVLEGSPSVWIDGELYPLWLGDAVAFPVESKVCHTFINNSDFDARLLVVGEATKKENKCYYPFHPARNEEIRQKNFLWEDFSPNPMGSHDGLPDSLRGER